MSREFILFDLYSPSSPLCRQTCARDTSHQENERMREREMELGRPTVCEWLILLLIQDQASCPSRSYIIIISVALSENCTTATTTSARLSISANWIWNQCSSISRQAQTPSASASKTKSTTTTIYNVVVARSLACSTAVHAKHWMNNRDKRDRPILLKDYKHKFEII